MSDAKPETDSFEDSLAELEALVDRMESGDLTLDQSLQAFERGIALTRTCQQALQAAEQRVEILTGDRADAPTEAFEDDA
jgi:exodeoxyribonuclease VII small subunit